VGTPGGSSFFKFFTTTYTTLLYVRTKKNIMLVQKNTEKGGKGVPWNYLLNLCCELLNLNNP